jgi:FkbM family methyltransferase
MHSQNHEDDFIVEYFSRDEKPGRFLDIGAHDGRQFSNTVALIDLGWSGVMCEPSPIPFANLLRACGDNERLTLVNAAVSPVSEWSTFHDPGGDMIGSTNERHVKKWAKHPGVTYRKFDLRTVSVASLLDRFGPAFDFINVDVEGESASLFLALLDAGATARCWCIEHDSRFADILERATPLCLGERLRNGENIILCS